MRPELPILIKARAKIADPANWGKGIRTVTGARSLETCCAAEALEAAESSWSRRRSAVRAFVRAADIKASDICKWNDAPERTHAEVLAAFDKAIASAS